MSELECGPPRWNWIRWFKKCFNIFSLCFRNFKSNNCQSGSVIGEHSTYRLLYAGGPFEAFSWKIFVCFVCGCEYPITALLSVTQPFWTGSHQKSPTGTLINFVKVTRNKQLLTVSRILSNLSPIVLNINNVHQTGRILTLLFERNPFALTAAGDVSEEKKLHENIPITDQCTMCTYALSHKRPFHCLAHSEFPFQFLLNWKFPSI